MAKSGQRSGNQGVSPSASRMMSKQEIASACTPAGTAGGPMHAESTGKAGTESTEAD
jgi:hypothetical protein